MKRQFIVALFLGMVSTTICGQTLTNLTVPEPEFVNSYLYVESNSKYSSLPKERGEIKEHKSKWKKIAEVGSAVASAGLSVAGASIGLGGYEAAHTAIQTMHTASTIGSAASAINTLAGIEGMDIVFDGKSSSFVVPKGSDVNIIYRDRDNETDPQDMMRVVKFNSSKKDRRIRWFNYSVAKLATEEATKNGYLTFNAKKYGKTSYLITIPASLLEKGEYGIVVGTASLSTFLPIATFSIQ